MPLDTLEPNPVWNADAHEETVETLAALDDVTYHIWGGDWCGDCRSLLPEFGAALAAADIPDEHVVHHPVDQQKDGEGVEEYGIEYIPTVVVERDGEELARFVEDEGQPIASHLATQLESAETSA
ncbi:thioredoxin [Halorhabdus sp. CBA1104]|uniref:thioredoxin family protein n=1 Tax=unclassified Halorhabdus TaxID=2621901 RepID=UPI0012B2AA74|nr:MULTISPECIES: thioredoxin family protein [unclassified Halorhabdus]QGN07107.1 thioredoxin [Halorhabdus sp. CBA1104]